MGGIVKIDPLTGASSLHYTAATTVFAILTYDSYRDMLVFAQVDSGIVGIDANGVITRLATPSPMPSTLAARGDGIIYMQLLYDFYYMDASNNILPLLDVPGTGTYSEGIGSSITEMQYDEGTNSLIMITPNGNFGPCTTYGNTCAAKVPLLPSGTQVAGALTGVTVDVSTSSELVAGSGHRDAGGIVFFVDTNINNQEARMQLLDPVAMTLSTYASNGYYTGAAVISAGTYSNVLDQAVFDDSFWDLIRGFSLGTSGGGTTISTSASGWGVSSAGGHSEFARMAEIDKPTQSDVRPGEYDSGNRLLTPYPNPFNPSTTIRFRLAQAAPARLEIFDVRGEHVRTLFDEVRPAGWQDITWQGQGAAGTRVASGVYFARLSLGIETLVQRLVLVE
jgi:hypothetical protein